MLFGDLIFHYVIGRALAESHPSKDFAHCINRRQVKHKCTACADICPEGVYSGPGCREADFMRCINCNLCVAACPTRCIASSATNAASYLQVLKAPEETILIASKGYGGAAHLKVDYFAILPWEYLACVSLCKKVVFLTRDMPKIGPKADEVWQRTLESLVLFWGKERFHQRFRFTEQAEAGVGIRQEIDRRELFKKADEGLRSKLSAYVPSQSMMDGSLYRRLLKDLLAEKDSGPFGWMAPLIAPGCQGCGVCEKLCPQGALGVKKEGERSSVVFDPSRCNGCGLCVKTCIHHAIDGFGVARIRRLDPLLLFDSGEDGAGT